MTRTEELLALADKATPGPWEWINPMDDSPWDGSGYASLRTVKHYGEDKTEIRDGLRYTSFSLPKFLVEAEEITSTDDATFISACNPETIKQLVELVRLQHDSLLCPGEAVLNDDAIAAFHRFAQRRE